MSHSLSCSWRAIATGVNTWTYGVKYFDGASYFKESGVYYSNWGSGLWIFFFFFRSQLPYVLQMLTETSLLLYSICCMLVGQYLNSTKYCSTKRGTTKPFELGKDILQLHAEITFGNYANGNTSHTCNLVYESEGAAWWALLWACSGLRGISWCLFYGDFIPLLISGIQHKVIYVHLQ